ncbi:MAG TPA: oxidoreductase, partial [Acidimicrobiaceae bacterium]|nr:oxidoreductase [Acidimicrobiaceae bacterium]
MVNCAFVGLGVMGYPMAGHLQAAGHATTVYNRTTARAEAWIDEHGGRSASTPAAAAEGADFVMMCVGDDHDVRSVVFGESGVLAGMGSGATLIDHTTASALVAREVSEAAAGLGVGFVDAPVSGGQAGAETGQLSIMCGGDPEVFAGIEAIVDAYAKALVLVGPVGAGQLTKMVNQICIGGLIQGLAEALDFARRAGL